MISQDTKNLTIAQIKRLIRDNGVAANGNEYCLESLHNALSEKQQRKAEKTANKATSSVMREFIASYAPIAENFSNVFPPEMPKPKNHSTLIVEKPVEKPANKYLFQFSQPLWLAEKLTLDQRLEVFKCS